MFIVHGSGRGDDRDSDPGRRRLAGAVAIAVALVYVGWTLAVLLHETIRAAIKKLFAG